MHEYSIASSLLKMAEEHAAMRGAERVIALEVRVGEMSGVEPELLETAWSLVRERSVCEGASLGITHVEACWACRRCGESVPRGGLLTCRACGGPAELVTGNELLLGRIEMEV